MTSNPDTTHPNAEAFPSGLSRARAACARARGRGIRSMAQLAQHSEPSVAALHGMDPRACGS